MSFKATDHTPPKPDLSDLSNDPDLAAKMFQDAQPDPKTTASAKETPSETLPEISNPYAPEFNQINGLDGVAPTDKTPKADGAATADADVITDPFNPKFNVPGKLNKPGEAGPKPDVILNPFDPNFVELPKEPKDGPKPGVKGADQPGQIDMDPFDPFKNWDSIPGLVPMDKKPVAPPAEQPKPADTPVKPVEPVKPEAPKPTDKIEPSPSDKIVPNPVFNESNVGEAVKLAQSKNQQIIVISTPDGKVGATEAAAMQANASDAVFVNVNFQKADQMMRAGLETTHYWQLANLCGAGGDVNNLYQKPGFIGRFNPSDFNAQDPQGSLKAVAANDVEKVFSGTVKPPTPGPVAPGPVRTDSKVEPVAPPTVPGPDGKVVPPTDTTDTPAVPPADKVEPKPQVIAPDKLVNPNPEAVVKPGTSDAPIEPKDAPAKPEKTGPVKLPKTDFETNDIEQAVQAAKDNNLPLIVYRGSQNCRYCPPVKANMAQFGKEMEGKSTTDAVVLRLDHSMLGALQRSNPAAAAMMDDIVRGTGFPNVAVFNPNNLKQPIADVRGDNLNEVRSLIQSGRNAMGSAEVKAVKPSQPTDGVRQPGTAAAEIAPPSTYNENTVLDAAKAAREKNVPMISYVDGQADPKVAKALQYLQENGLASTLSISPPKADKMLQAGMEQSKFWALKNAMEAKGDTKSGAHLSSFAPTSLKPGQRFAPGQSTNAKASADDIVGFLKQSGVDLSKNNSEAAVRALLDGAPIPPAPKPEAQKPEVKPADVKPEVPVPGQPQATDLLNPVVPPAVVNPEAPVKPEVAPPPAEVKPVAPVEPAAVKPEVAPPPAEVTPLTPFDPAAVREVAPPPAEAQKPKAPVEPAVNPEAPVEPAVKPEVVAPPAEAPKPQVPAQPEVEKPASLVEPAVLKKLGLPDAAEILPVKAEEKGDKTNAFKVKTADEALKVLEDAKKSNKPLVVHSFTVICTDLSCTPTKLDKSVPGQFGDEANFLELPRGGVDVPAGAQYDELRKINDLYKVTDEDHKTSLDIHVFNVNSKTGAYEANNGTDSRANPASFVRSRLNAIKKP